MTLIPDVASEGRCAIGLDVGKTKTRGGILAADGSLHDVVEVPTPRGRDAETAYSELLHVVGALQGAAERPQGLGLAVSGAVDFDSGATVDGGGSALISFPLRERLERDTGLAVGVDNDANLAALAEAVMGAGAAYAVVVYLTLSTGIGCGIVREGEILRGAHHSAGEIYAVPVSSEATVERLAGGRALSEAASRAFGRPVTTEGLFTLASAGDAKAKQLVADAIAALQMCYSWISALIDPDVVVVGGSVARHQPHVVSALDARAHRPTGRRALVVTAGLGADAELLGAGLLARRAAAAARR